jgi:two-component system KDP operon response regulator KdpE
MMTDEHRRILVVDDEPQITRVLRTTLSAQGYDIRVANDGEMALELMKNWTPHVLIMESACAARCDRCRRCRSSCSRFADKIDRRLKLWMREPMTT